MSDYTIPCAKSSVHPTGICRKKLHLNIGNGFHRLVERLDTEAKEQEMENQRMQYEEAKKNMDAKFKMSQVLMGTHRVIKDNRKKPG